MREDWLRSIAERSREEKWSLERAEWEIRDDLLDPAMLGHFTSRAALDQAIREARRAAQPDVRNHFEHLVTFRNGLWEKSRKPLRASGLHGPYQALADITARWANPDERHHVADERSYLNYRRSS